MNEFELLEQLQIIRTKLENNEKLTDPEYKIYTTIILGLGIGIMKRTTDLLLKALKGDKND